MTVRTLLIGAGGMARSHLPLMIQHGAQIVAVCEPSQEQYELTCERLDSLEHPLPPNQPDLAQLLVDFAGQLDVAFIITPHSLHHAQTKACLEAGLDVLLEKPMVMNATEAQDLIRISEATNRLLVVAFQGGLSPQVREAARLIQSGELGELLNVSGTVWQNWKGLSANTWRVQPHMSGGGFLFDTGAHMLNTVCTLVGQDFAQVAAWLDNRGMEVDIIGAMVGKLDGGALVTINASGDTIRSCESEITVFLTEGIIRTGQWGERLLVRKEGESEFSPVDLPPMRGAWEQFMQVRAGEIENPCPPSVGLRMAKLWDAIRASAEQDGARVRC